MPWEKPTLKQLNERIAQDFSGRLLDGGKVVSRSVIAVFAKVWAGACNSLHIFLAWMFKQVFVDTAETVYLERWARVWKVYRKTSSAAGGVVLWPAPPHAQEIIIPQGSVLFHQKTEQQFSVIHDVVVASGETSLPVAALAPGSAGNLPAGEKLSLVTPIAGLVGVGVVAPAGLSGGMDEEGDENLRERLLARLRQPPRGGAKHDYEFWAKEVPGVTRAWCYPLGNGVGTISLTFVTDNAPEDTGGPFPTLEMVQRVQEHIDALRPASVKEFEVFAPSPLPVTVRLKISPDSATVRESITTELHDFMVRVARPDTVIPLSHFNEAISLAPGEEDHKLVEPVADIVVPKGYFPVLESIEFVATEFGEG